MKPLSLILATAIMFMSCKGKENVTAASITSGSATRIVVVRDTVNLCDSEPDLRDYAYFSKKKKLFVGLNMWDKKGLLIRGGDSAKIIEALLIELHERDNEFYTLMSKGIKLYEGEITIKQFCALNKEFILKRETR